MKFILLFAMTCGPVLAQIVPIQGTDTVAGSRTTINNNFSYLDVKTTGIDCSSGTCTFTKMGIPTTTVAALPAAASNTGVVYFVTDSASTSSCATGGGANILMCRSNGASWLVVSGGGGGSGGTIASTTDLPEGTNLYHTLVRVRAALAAAGTCGTYNNSTGVIDFSGCAALSHSHNGSAINAGVVDATVGGLGVNAGSFDGVLKMSGGLASVVTGTGSNCVHQDGSSAPCPTGSGNVVNSGTSTTKAIPRFVGTAGTAIENTPVLISDAGQITAPGGFVSGDGSQAGEIRLTELSVNGTDYLSMLGQANRTTTLRIRWPATDPTTGQIPSFSAPISNISDVTWVDPGTGSGDVTGPGSATANAAARYNSTTGKVIKNSAVGIDDSGNITTPGTINTTGSVAGQVVLGEASANGSNTHTLKAPDTIATNLSTTLPATQPGESGQVLSGDTAGNLTYRDAPGVGDCPAGEFVNGLTNAGAPACATPAAGGGGGTTGLYSGTLNFASISDGGCNDQTYAATGITQGSSVAISLPSTWPDGVLAIALAATNSVKFRACNFSGAAVDPASGTFSVRNVESLGYLFASRTYNSPAIPDGGCGTFTITLSGATAGNNVAAGWPGPLEANLIGSMFVSAADTVTVSLCNWSGASLDPANATYSAAITK